MPLRNQMSPSNPVRPPFEVLLTTHFTPILSKGQKGPAHSSPEKALQTGKVFVYLDLSGDVADNDPQKPDKCTRRFRMAPEVASRL